MKQINIDKISGSKGAFLDTPALKLAGK